MFFLASREFTEEFAHSFGARCPEFSNHVPPIPVAFWPTKKQQEVYLALMDQMLPTYYKMVVSTIRTCGQCTNNPDGELSDESEIEF